MGLEEIWMDDKAVVSELNCTVERFQKIASIYMGVLQCSAVVLGRQYTVKYTSMDEKLWEN